MKSNLFNHYVDVFCKKFLGYCLFYSATQIQKNGTGVYIFDFKNRTYEFDGKAQRKLQVADEIQGWFDEMLKKDGCSIDEITVATLRIQCGAPKNTRLPTHEPFEFHCFAQIKYQNKVFEKMMSDKNSDLSMVSS